MSEIWRRERTVKNEGKETGEVLIRGVKEMRLRISDYYGFCHWREEQDSLLILTIFMYLVYWTKNI